MVLIKAECIFDALGTDIQPEALLVRIQRQRIERRGAKRIGYFEKAAARRYRVCDSAPRTSSKAAAIIGIGALRSLRSRQFNFLARVNA
jgi:hypothetical protein